VLTTEQIQYAVDKKTYQFQFWKLVWISPQTHVFQSDDNFGLQHVIITLTNNKFARVQIDLGYTTSSWYDCTLEDVQNMASVFFQKWGPDPGSVWQGTASLNGNYGPIGTHVEIIGTYLLGSTIMFGPVEITPETLTDNFAAFEVPNVADGNYVITVNGTNIGTFSVREPNDTPLITYVVQSESLYVTIIGDGFHSNETTIVMFGVTYNANVIKPTECNFLANVVMGPFVLTTPHGSVAYP
jgi:hypothetical protein